MLTFHDGQTDDSISSSLVGKPFCNLHPSLFTNTFVTINKKRETSIQTSTHKMTATPPINNPYAKPLQSTLRIMTRKNDFYNIFSTMGCQSQIRGGAIKSCLKKGTKAKHRKTKRLRTAADGRAFIQERDCIICAAHHRKKFMSRLGFDVFIPHKAHNVRCPNNRSTQGRSVKYVEVDTTATKENKNNESMQHLLLPVGTSARAEKSEAAPVPVPDSLASDLCDELSRCVGKGSDAWAETCSAPTAIALLMDYIVRQFEHRRPKSTKLPTTESFLSARNRYHTFFPAETCIFTFPKCFDNSLSPQYHAITGQSIFYLDWQLSHPQATLCCFDCKSTTSTLQHDRTNFSKNRNLFPVWLPQGIAMWGSVMVYECTECGARYAANNSRLLSLLPAHI
jgi:hypothetical protein